MTLAALVAGLALLAAVPAADAAPAATSHPTNTCWLDVVNDWLDHNGQIHQQYPIACYTQAIQHLNQYPDVQNYSNAEDDIHRALLAVLRQDRGGGPGAGSVVTVPPSPDKGGGSSSKGVVTRVADALNPGSAQSVPLPLIVLGILALLLMLTALGTWIAKRMQARRPTPATAPATPRSRRR
jgi:hypothetical protein